MFGGWGGIGGSGVCAVVLRTGRLGDLPVWSWWRGGCGEGMGVCFESVFLTSFIEGIFSISCERFLRVKFLEASSSTLTS